MDCIVSECAIDGENKRIYITSAYKTKNSTNRVLNMETNNSPQPTSKTPFGDRAINDSISNPSEKSNLSDEKVQIPCRAALAQGEPEIKNPDA